MAASVVVVFVVLVVLVLFVLLVPLLTVLFPALLARFMRGFRPQLRGAPREPEQRVNGQNQISGTMQARHVSLKCNSGAIGPIECRLA